jgi:glycosyltransferase involved in cell wall biosynthesis
MRKVLMLATTAAMIEQFNKNNIRILQDMGYEVHVAGNFHEGNPISDEKLKQFQEWITAGGGTWFHIPATRKPLDFKNNIAAYRAILQLIREQRYDFIHCHTPIGSVLGRVAAHQTGTKIIYTAHGFHFFQGAPLKNWLLYYPIERFLSRWTDVLICINHEDYDRARRTFHAKRTEYVPGVGVDTDVFRSTNETDTVQKRKELGIGAEDIVLLSVGELNKNKNHQVVIQAMKECNLRNLHYIIVGRGRLAEKLKELSKQLGMEARVHIAGFQENVQLFYGMADIYVQPSLREGLSVSLMEAMAEGLVCIVSDIRGNIDLIEDEKGGYLCNPNDANAFAEKINALSNCKELCNEMGKYNMERVKKFDEKIINRRMKELYDKVGA